MSVSARSQPLLASINDLGNIAIYSLLILMVLAMFGLPVPLVMFVCHIVVIVACVISGN